MPKANQQPPTEERDPADFIPTQPPPPEVLWQHHLQLHRAEMGTNGDEWGEDEESKRHAPQKYKGPPYDGRVLLEAIRDNLDKPDGLPEELRAFLYMRLTMLFHRLDSGPLTAEHWYDIFHISPVPDTKKRGRPTKSSPHDREREFWIVTEYIGKRKTMPHAAAFKQINDHYSIGEKALEALVTKYGLAPRPRKTKGGE